MRCALLSITMVLACKGDPLATPAKKLVGTWQEQGIDSTQLVSQSTFVSGGDYELKVSEKTEHGRWKLAGSQDKPELRTCIEGDRCKTGGIWTVERFELIGDDILVTSDDHGNGKRRYHRVAAAPR